MVPLLQDPNYFDTSLQDLVGQGEGILQLCRRFRVSQRSPQYASKCQVSAGIFVNPRQLIARHEGMSLLRVLLASFRKASAGTYAHTAPWLVPSFIAVRPVLYWNTLWGRSEDSMLLNGIAQHGFGEWASIGNLSTTASRGRTFLGSESLIPNEIVLERRATYLLGLLIDHKSSLLQMPAGSQAMEYTFIPTKPSRTLATIDDSSAKAIELSPVPPPPSSRQNSKIPPPTVSAKPRGTKRKRVTREMVPPESNTSPLSAQSLASRSFITNPRPYNRFRAELGRKWSEIGRGAPITFVNEIDDEDIPSGMLGFTYLEDVLDM